MQSANEVLEQGTVVEAHDTCLMVEVDGVELFVRPTVKRRNCTCCGDVHKLEVIYNRPTEDRIDAHGEADPLGIE